MAPLTVDELLVGLGLQRPGGSELGDLTGAHAQIAATVDSGTGVEQVDIAKKKVGGLLWAMDERRGGHRLRT